MAQFRICTRSRSLNASPLACILLLAAGLVGSGACSSSAADGSALSGSAGHVGSSSALGGDGGGAAGDLSASALGGTAEQAAAQGGASSRSVTTVPLAPISITVDIASSHDISPMLFGQNYWNWVPEWGAQVDNVKDLATALKLGLLRVGGTYPDIAEPIGFDESQIDKYVGYCRNIGAEPLYQLPFVAMRDGADTIVPSTPEGAGAIVKYINVTRGYGVKYFSIGNEPDIYEDQKRTIGGQSTVGYTADQFCASFQDYVAQVKAVDPTVKIMGPELSWKYRGGIDWLTPFLKGCGSLVDVVTVHRYPFDSTQDTAEFDYIDAIRFRSTIRGLRDTMKAVGAGDKPLAITEAHVTWDSDPSKLQLTGAPGTVAAGLWIADSLGVAMEENLWSLAFWSLSESWTLGFIDSAKPKPEYYAMLTVGNHFRSKIASVTGSTQSVSVYAGRNALSTPVLVVNKTAEAQSLEVTIKGAPSAIPVTAVAVAPYSVTVFEFPDDGGAPAVEVAKVQ